MCAAPGPGMPCNMHARIGLLLPVHDSLCSIGPVPRPRAGFLPSTQLRHASMRGRAWVPVHAQLPNGGFGGPASALSPPAAPPARQADPALPPLQLSCRWTLQAIPDTSIASQGHLLAHGASFARPPSASAYDCSLIFEAGGIRPWRSTPGVAPADQRNSSLCSPRNHKSGVSFN